MALLAPTALFGLLLLAIPILAHLFKPRKMRPVPFSSLRWLKQTQQRLSRRIQWHQWLLFLARASIVVFLVFALARPLIGSRRGGRPMDRFIIVDNSPAMAIVAKDSFSPYQRARELVKVLMERAEPEDRVAVLLAGSPPKVILPLSKPSGELAVLPADPPSSGEATLTSILPLVHAMRVDVTRDTELIFLTANLQPGWRQSEIETFLSRHSGDLRVRVADLGASTTNNAWIAGARLIDRGADQDRILRVELRCVGEAQQERTIRLTDVKGLAGDEQRITLNAGAPMKFDFLIPAGQSLRNEIAEIRLEPADALPGDDVHFLPLEQTWSREVLLIQPEAAEGEQGTALFPRTALEALSAVNDYALTVSVRTEKVVTPAEVKAADLIFLCGVHDLSDAVIEMMETRVRQGAGAVLFLGPAPDTPLYQEKLYRRAQPNESLLSLTTRPGGPAVMNRTGDTPCSVRWTHPLLYPLSDPRTGDLALAQFHRYAALQESAHARAEVLFRTSDGTPLMFERALGAGRVLVLNTTASDEWTDLPRRRAFLPLLDGMLGYLGGNRTLRTFTPGSVLVPLPEATNENLIVVTPGGEKRPGAIARHGGRTFLAANDIREAGRYHVERDSETWLTFAVNPPRLSSPLAPMDAKTLVEWWGGERAEVVSGEGMHKDLQEGSTFFSLWPILLVLASVAFLVETLYVAWLCPRKNPSAVQSRVPTQGILKSVATE